MMADGANPLTESKPLPYLISTSYGRLGHLRALACSCHVIEHLVAHELVHLLEPSHTAAFWERLERVVPDHAGRQRWLRERGGRYDL